MAYEDMRTGINTLLIAVAGIGKVYKRHIVLKKPINFVSTFTSGDPAIINTWEITNASPISEMPEAIGSGANIRRRFWNWQIEGWYQFNYNGSEAAFDALVEAICTKFRGENLIGGVGYQSENLQVTSKDLVGYNGNIETEAEGILCHHGILTLEISKAF